jgi:hypothetical protein
VPQQVLLTPWHVVDSRGCHPHRIKGAGDEHGQVPRPV